VLYSTNGLPALYPYLAIASKKRAKILRRQSRLAQDGSQGSCVEFLMIRDNDLSKGRVAAKDDVAAVLPFNLKIDFEKSRNASPP
jgi:hypothetical protein